MLPEMMTLKEICEYFRVEKRVLLRYGLSRLGGVCLGPRSWRFPRNEVMKHGIQKLQQQQRQVPLDRPEDCQRQEAAEEFFDQKGSIDLGIPATPAGRIKDPHGILA